MSEQAYTRVRVSGRDILEFLGFVTSVFGTALVSLNLGLEFIAFVSYAISNIAWICFSRMQRYRWLLAQNAIFMVLTINGLINFWPL